MSLLKWFSKGRVTRVPTRTRPPSFWGGGRGARTGPLPKVTGRRKKWR